MVRVITREGDYRVGNVNNQGYFIVRRSDGLQKAYGSDLKPGQSPVKESYDKLDSILHSIINKKKKNNSNL
ncbi:MAG TPA: hypothetical protein PK639_01090 [Candidatus Woesebacteria bacterium]|nr:hypothetical protein [Candidatus Woesebacteria bacterium]